DVISYTAVMQGWLGLPIDGTRGYVEHSLSWVSWYLGWPLLAAAGVAAVVLTWRGLGRPGVRWLPRLLGCAGAAAPTLLGPGITPDRPWADRRLVVGVIPAMVLLATWACAELVRWLRRALRAGPHAEAGGKRAGRGAVAVPLAAVLTMGVLAAPAISVTGP